MDILEVNKTIPLTKMSNESWLNETIQQSQRYPRRKLRLLDFRTPTDSAKHAYNVKRTFVHLSTYCDSIHRFAEPRVCC